MYIKKIFTQQTSRTIVTPTLLQVTRSANLAAAVVAGEG